MEKIEEMPHSEVGLVVGASTSLASPGSAPPQAKMLKLAQEHFGLAHKLLTVSNRTTRVLEYLYLFDRVVDTDLLPSHLSGVVGAGEQPAPRRLRATRSKGASEQAHIREGCTSGEEQEDIQG